MSTPSPLSTNLAELPFATLHRLAVCLNASELWLKVAGSEADARFYLSCEEVEKISRQKNPGSAYLNLLGNRGQTVGDFLKKMQALSYVFGSLFDEPQLILRRKFAAIIWSRSCQISVTFIENGLVLKLKCHAKGFPYPSFQWFRDGVPIEGEHGNTVLVKRCRCVAGFTFHCRINNEIVSGREYSRHYRSGGKQLKSELISKDLELSSYLIDADIYTAKRSRSFGVLFVIRYGPHLFSVQSLSTITIWTISESTGIWRFEGYLFAVDKVALVISNCHYENLPDLLTPHCDAETLAQILQEMQFKTVTMGDLKLEELKMIVKEYKKLLGNGVYALFYFVGHGFEANGECYLLPVDAPAEGYTLSTCISMDWILGMQREYCPALNLVLLDICRKFLPCDVTVFKRSHDPDTNVTINRNTVFGYATSFGVSAYEIQGENNGVFMTCLKNHLASPKPVIDMLNRVFRDIENNKDVCNLQIPELRSNLTHPRSLSDPLVIDGHTLSFEYHTTHWRFMHELPSPKHVNFPELSLKVTIWFDFVGHFTNKVYVFSSVGDYKTKDSRELDDDQAPSTNALNHLAFLKFPENLESSGVRIIEDDEEGNSLRILLSHLQRSNGEITSRIELIRRGDGTVVATAEALLGHMLITRMKNE